MAKHNKHTATQAAQAPAQATQAATPAPAAPAPAPSAAPVNAALAVVYTAGKAYNVRTGTAQANDRSWAALQTALQAGGGQATLAQLRAAVEPFNHVPFVGYCVRRGWLTPVVQAPAQAPSTQAA